MLFLTVSFLPVKKRVLFYSLRTKCKKCSSGVKCNGLRELVTNSTVVGKGIVDMGHLCPVVPEKLVCHVLDGVFYLGT